MSTTINTTLDDMKDSFRLAKNNILSFFLANLGMLIVMGILAALIAIPITAAAFVLVAPLSEATIEAFTDWAMANPLAVGGISLLVLIPLVSVFLTVEGSIYGMTHDLITTGETKAELAFSYFRHKFLTLAGAGMILTIVIALPPVAVWGLASIASGYVIGPAVAAVLSVFTFIWVFLTAGLTSMVWPAVVSGKGVQDAFKESISLSNKHFERVFGLVSAIVLLIAISFGPIILWALTSAPVPPVPDFWIPGPFLIGAASWTLIAVFLWLLVFLPMVRIAFVKVYQELTGGRVVALEPAQVPIV
ncbi:hypothetical protein EU524_01620 [Candidatus Thorarchaeota archaeon]|nr:MAG: hypothetical protein EU524_01620 [Candidatus Thorarchaeota archaeon]